MQEKKTKITKNLSGIFRPYMNAGRNERRFFSFLTTIEDFCVQQHNDSTWSEISAVDHVNKSCRLNKQKISYSREGQKD